MAVAPGIKMTSAIAALDAIVDAMDEGTAANPKIKIFDNSAAQPDDPDTTTPTGSKTLATIDLGTGAVFPGATTGTGGDSGSAVCACTTPTRLPKSDTDAPTTGTAAWFRAFDKDSVAKIDGSVGTATADLILDSVSITAGQTVKINTWEVKLPNGG